MTYDLETKNNSFLEMYKNLKKKNIKNNKFFLALFNSNLQDISIWPDEESTSDKSESIIKEIKLNPWYFIREVAGIRTPDTTENFILTEEILATIFCIMNKKSVIFNTENIDIILFYYCSFANKKAACIDISDDLYRYSIPGYIKIKQGTSVFDSEENRINIDKLDLSRYDYLYIKNAHNIKNLNEVLNHYQLSEKSPIILLNTDLKLNLDYVDFSDSFYDNNLPDKLIHIPSFNN